MKPFRSRPMALEVAAILKRMTGERTDVVVHYSERNYVYWRVFRTDPAGNEHEV